MIFATVFKNKPHDKSIKFIIIFNFNVFKRRDLHFTISDEISQENDLLAIFSYSNLLKLPTSDRIFRKAIARDIENQQQYMITLVNQGRNLPHTIALNVQNLKNAGTHGGLRPREICEPIKP